MWLLVHTVKGTVCAAVQARGMAAQKYCSFMVMMDCGRQGSPPLPARAGARRGVSFFEINLLALGLNLKPSF